MWTALRVGEDKEIILNWKYQKVVTTYMYRSRNTMEEEGRWAEPE